MSSGNSLVELQRTQIWPEIQWAFQECQNSHGCFSHLLPSFSAGAAIWSLPPSDNGCVPTVRKTWPMCFRHLRAAAETKRLNFNSPKCLKRTWRKQQQKKKELGLVIRKKEINESCGLFCLLIQKNEILRWDFLFSFMLFGANPFLFQNLSILLCYVKRSEYTTSKVFFWVCGFYYLM